MICMRQNAYKENTIMNAVRIMVSFASVVFFSLLACSPQTPEKAESESPTESPEGENHTRAISLCYPEIVVGITTNDEVINLLGSPVRQFHDDSYDMDVWLYPSDNGLIPNAVFLQNDLVQYLSGKFGEEHELTLTSLVEKLGEPSQKMYSNYAEGTMMYIYPDLGAGYLVNEKNQGVLFEYLFVPMMMDEYLRLWGKDLSLEDPYTR